MDKINNKAIVITSIFYPTEAVIAFSEMKEYRLFVVGDKKTPGDWFCKNVGFLSIANQEKSQWELAQVLPFNHYCRKMIGYLEAISHGASFIIDTDDDNIPKAGWSFPAFNGRYDCVSGLNDFVNIYQLFTDQFIWPRGLPLDLIKTSFNLEKHIQIQDCNVGIWQGLADDDPDVDAVYRLTNNNPCFFNTRNPVVLSHGIVSPFNSQNTMFRKELFPLLYLPTYVTFRFTDILRGLIAQPIMWLYNYNVGFVDATVIQKRNPHNYLEDFKSEVPMYQTGAKIIDIVSSAINKNDSIADNIYNAYTALLKEKVVQPEEMITLRAWLNDMSKLSQK